MANPAAETSVVTATTLIFVGGYLDAFTFTGHGGVFATAQSGNVILLGAGLAQGDMQRVVHHLLPIIAFVIGTLAMRAIREAAAARGLKTEFILLSIEAAILAALLPLPDQTSNLLVATTVAFAATLQFTGFGTAQGLTYVSVATTGNLRRLLDAAYDAARGNAPDARVRVRTFAAITAGFLAGAAVGAAVTHAVHNLAMAVPVAALVLLLFRIRARAA